MYLRAFLVFVQSEPAKKTDELSAAGMGQKDLGRCGFQERLPTGK